MANYSFSFNKVNKRFFNVELKDGKKLQVKMPTKKVFEALKELQDMDTANVDAALFYDDLSTLCAAALSNNMTKEKITAEYIAEEYDLKELTDFVKEFFVYVGEEVDSPN